MAGLLLSVVVLLGSACSPQETAAENDCADPIAAAEAADRRARNAHRAAQAVREEPIDPNLREESTEGEWTSPASEARAEAAMKARRERERLTTEARSQLFRWATIIDQNGDCFGADARATAAQVLYEFSKETG